MYVVICVTEYNEQTDYAVWGPFEDRKSAEQYNKTVQSNCMGEHVIRKIERIV